MPRAPFLSIPPPSRRTGSERRLVVRSLACVWLVTAGGCASDSPGGLPPDTAGGPRVITSSVAPSGTQPTSTATAAIATTLPPDSVAVPSTAAPHASSSGATSVPPPSPAASELVLIDAITALDKPVDLAVRTGDDAFYIVEQGGRVQSVRGDGRRVVLDVTDLTAANGEQGLLGLAFSPDGRWGYINYTDVDGNTVIAAVPVAADGSFDRAGQRTILQVAQPYANHNGGDLHFGPDGMLYIGMGDGGSGGDPQRNASNLDSLLGKMLRIEPTPEASDPYQIPPDNPFAGDEAGAGRAPEIWSWGLRNPWRFNFDSADGSLWIADVGQSAREEVDHVVDEGGGAGRGVNFGWSAIEGDLPFNDDVAADGAVAPVVVYDHDVGCSISGGAVYRGDLLVGVTGDYFYGDYCAGTLWAYNPTAGSNRTVATSAGSIVAVRSGPDGEIYVLTNDGRAQRIVAR